jgi:DNA-binding NtrC family response regulator
MSQSETSAQAAAKSTLFVVDDEPVLLDLAETLLRPLGFEIRTFDNPRTALAEFAAANPRPAIIITDYEMNASLMNGMDLIRQSRWINPYQKTILVSGSVDETVFANSREKPDFFLPKPYQAERLVEIVHTLADKPNFTGQTTKSS